MPLRRRPKGPAGGQFSPEDRPDDPPLAEDDLLMQVTEATRAADPEGEVAEEAETSEGDDEIKLFQDHFRGRG